MSKRVTFIHASDLHLGAPFRGLRALSSKWANRLLSAIPESYDRMVDAAIARDVDFVVVSGDIFDSARPSYGDYLHFFEGLERLGEAGIPVYLITGNHDPYTSWQHDFFSLPPNATMLPGDRPGFALVERDGQPLCLIGGRGYYNQTWPMDECIAEGVTREAAEQALAVQHPHAAEAPFAVGLLHTGLNLDPVKAPVDPAVLMHAGMDYWALGHIHMKYAYPSFDDPRLVFSGCIQGRDIKETGERGVFCVTLREGAKNELEFIPTASVVWQRMHVDVSDCANLPDITDKIMRELFRENGKAHCAGGRDPDARHARPRRCDRRPAQTRERCVFGILLRRVDEPHGAAARQGGAAPRRAVPCGVPAGGGRAAAQSRRGHRVFAG